jgi:hypothetical protein
MKQAANLDPLIGRRIRFQVRRQQDSTVKSAICSQFWGVSWRSPSTKRTRAATSPKMGAAFRNENSCLLLFYAVVRSLRFVKLKMPATSQEQPASTILHNS